MGRYGFGHELNFWGLFSLSSYSKVASLTDEINTLRNNCKSLEAQDRESTEREEKYEAQIKQLRDGLDEVQTSRIIVLS